MDKVTVPAGRPQHEGLIRPAITPAVGGLVFVLIGAIWFTVSRSLADYGLALPMAMTDASPAAWGLLGMGGLVVYLLLRLAFGHSLINPSLDHLPEAAIVLDGQGRMITWNLRAEELVGGEVDWANRPFIETAIPGEQDALSRTIAGALSSGKAHFETRLRTADGTSIPCEGRASAMWGLKGQAAGLVIILHDIAAEQTTMRDLAEREHSLRQMVDLAPHLIAMIVDGRVVWMNGAGLHLMGAKGPGAVIGHLWTDILGSAAGGDRLRRLDGDWLDVEIASVPSLHDGRNATIIEARDVTPLRACNSTLDDIERRLSGIMDTVEDAIVSTDDKGSIQGFNRAAEALFGYAAREVIGRSITLLMPKEDAAEHLRRLERYLDSGDLNKHSIRDARGLRRDGTSMPLRVSLGESRAGGRRLFTAVIRDLSERKALHSRLTMAEKVLESTSEGIMLTNPAGAILWVNAGFTRISGYASDEVLGKNSNLLKSGLQGATFYTAMWAELGARGEWSGEIWNRRKDGEAFPEWLTIKAIFDEQGQLDRYVGVFSDISKHKRAEETIRHLTYYDPVTRLPNRYLFQDRIGQALERARRTDRKVALVLVSLDRFKTVNETLGHQVGDALLREVAQRLSNSVRAEDTVSRLRGDTFCCVLTELVHGHDANPVINRILDCFGQPFLVSGHELFVTTSLGIALFPLDGTEIDDLIQKAETAMNRSKERSENVYHFYTPEMNANSMERLRLETDLRKGIGRGELVLYYQPKVEAGSGKLVGAEALVRWRHPEYGMVPPARFIPIAEDTGLILPVGAQVLRDACHQVKLWRAQGLAPVKVAVNLSAHQFRQPDLVESIARILEEAEVPAELIELELTESAVMRNADAAVQTLIKLHNTGLSIAIDDFGTGYSSLSYLKKFPLDRLKIDRSFVQDLGTNQAGEEIVGAIIAMAHSLKMSVIAEGVETTQQLDMLRDLHCDEIQGFYFSRPVPAEDFGEIIKAGTLIGHEVV
jgi:diguanylate cyclase (GGDEF)-like protein/PAS domain S-box-containing protein